MDFQSLTIDQINEYLAWIADRHRYCIACNRPRPYLDISAEAALLAELRHRQEVTA